MKIVNTPTLVLTTKEHSKILEIVHMLCNTDADTDAYLDDIMKEMRGCSLLGVLEEILDRAKISD